MRNPGVVPGHFASTCTDNSRHSPLFFNDLSRQGEGGRGVITGEMEEDSQTPKVANFQKIKQALKNA